MHKTSNETGLRASGGGWHDPYGGSPPGGPPPGGGGPGGGGWGPPPGAPPGGYGPPPGGGGGWGPPTGGGYGPPPGAIVREAPYGIHPVTGQPYSDKSKVVAGILQLVMPFGIGRFYTGHTTLGILQAVVTFGTCGIGCLWPFIDGIMMLQGNVTDSDGRPLRNGM